MDGTKALVVLLATVIGSVWLGWTSSPEESRWWLAAKCAGWALAVMAVGFWFGLFPGLG